MNAQNHFDSSVPPELAAMVARCMGITVEQLAEQVRARREAAKRRVERNNARFAEALSRISEAQALIVEKKQAEGYKIAKLLVSRSSENVAVMLSKRPVWDPAKHAMGGKLLVVYPTPPLTCETFERSISIRKEF